MTTAREDLIAFALAALLVFGLFVDGWNHINLQANELRGFFTPWHGLLYLGFTLTALWALGRSGLLDPRHSLREIPSVGRLWRATPVGYRLGLVGIALAMVAVPGDAIWHSAFGEEVGVARVIGPFHVVLFTAIGLLVSCPLAAAWMRLGGRGRRGWRELGSAVGSLALIGCVGAFFVHWTASFVDWEPSIHTGELSPSLAARADVVETLHSHAVAGVLLTTIVLIVPLAVGWSRFRLPVGACTAIVGSVSLLSASLNEFSTPTAFAPGLIGGMVGDAVAARTGPGPGRQSARAVTATAIALATWLSFFALLRFVDGVSWPRDVWLGAVAMATFSAALIAALVNPGSSNVSSFVAPAAKQHEKADEEALRGR